MQVAAPGSLLCRGSILVVDWRLLEARGGSVSVELTAIDLFSGLGGTSLGLQRAGFRVVAAVESHELAAESYRLNMEGVYVWERDIRKVAARAVMEKAALARGELALLAACPPCQGFSALRTLNGNRRIEDHRNGLLRDVTRFVRVLKPMTVLAENVPGLASDAVFDGFLDALDALGYKLRHEVVDASQYGVPQRRRRLLIVASRLGRPPVGEQSRKCMTVRKALTGLPEVGSTGDVLHDAPERRTERIAAMIRLVPPDGGSRRDLGEEHQLDCHARTDGFKDIYGKDGLGERRSHDHRRLHQPVQGPVPSSGGTSRDHTSRSSAAAVFPA